MSRMFSARVFVTLKQTVNDPQGLTVRGALQTLGFQAVKDVRVGKLIDMQIEAESAEEAAKQVEDMGRQLLANPVIERFSYDVFEAAERQAATKP